MRHRSRVPIVVALAVASLALSILATPGRAAVVCDNSWRTAVGGQWSDATKWSRHHVPTATEHVCIRVAGTYIVGLDGTRQVAGLRLGGPGLGARQLYLSNSAAILRLHGDGAVVEGGSVTLEGGARVALDTGRTLVVSGSYGLFTSYGGGAVHGNLNVTPTGVVRAGEGPLDTRGGTTTVAGTVDLQLQDWRAGAITQLATGTIEYLCAAEQHGVVFANGAATLRGGIAIDPASRCTPFDGDILLSASTIGAAVTTYSGLYMEQYGGGPPSIFRPTKVVGGAASLVLRAYPATVSVPSTIAHGSDFSYVAPTAFLPGDTITISVRGSDGTFVLLDREIADANGGVFATMTLPLGVTLGPGAIYATGIRHVSSLVTNITVG